jgi:sec-independent protein translocase protein TatA
MLSIPDMAILGAAALLLFGPDQLPRILRKAGQVSREIQNTSQAFIREMERAADVHDAERAAAASPVYEPPAPDPQPVGEKLAEPRDPIEHAMAYPEEAVAQVAGHEAASPPLHGDSAAAQPGDQAPRKPHSADPAPY